MSLSIGRVAAPAGLRSSAPLALLLLALAAGLGTGFLVGQANASVAADIDLTRLLRAMAALKLLFVAAAAAIMLWRLQAPIGPGRLAGYAVTAFAMAAGPGLIWNLAHVVLGAALLHAGLLAAALLLWRDPAVGSLLAAALARRRARI